MRLLQLFFLAMRIFSFWLFAYRKSTFPKDAFDFTIQIPNRRIRFHT